jgi:nucleotide-binding universal stress UspA family protein
MKTILIPVDFSDVSYTAAKYAIDFATEFHIGKLIFYNSYKLHAVDADLAAPDDEKNVYKQASLKHLKEMYERVVGAGAPSFAVHFHADNKSVKDGVGKLVEAHDVSLIVMGIAGRSDIENTLIGENTMAVAASGVAPLLIVPREAVFEPVGKIVYATDLRNVEEVTPVSSIIKFCRTMGAGLHIVHADYEGKHHSPSADLNQQLLRQYFADLQPKFHYVEEHKDSAQGIYDYVKRNEIGLIIMASRNYGFFERLFHSSVSKKLLNMADVPVVLAKNKTPFV